MDKNLLPTFNLMKSFFAEAITDGLKHMLEEKHLYQDHSIVYPDINTIFDKLGEHINLHPIQIRGVVNYVYKESLDLEWKIQPPAGLREPSFYSQPDSDLVIVTIDFIPPTIRTYCQVCNNIEPFNYVHSVDFLKDLRKSPLEVKTNQFFVFAYQCQGCKSTPEIFLVQRQKMKLSLCGRSPAEQILIPLYIPKSLRKSYSDALVAFYSGQTLAGNYLLRNFIEQVIRRSSTDPISKDNDELFNEYAATLPDDFKAWFPSLQRIYYELAAYQESPTGADDLFQLAKEKIDLHFEARRLFERKIGTD